MTVGEVVKCLHAKVLVGHDLLDRQVYGAYSTDLLSDAMANAQRGQLWFTIQTHPNVVAVASLLDLGGVVITAGKQPEAETLARAEKEQVLILSTKLSTFEAAGRLYRRPAS